MRRLFFRGRRAGPSSFSRWIVLSVALLLGSAWAGTVLGAGDYASQPAGFVRLTVPGGESVFASTPFEPFDESLDAVFANQLVGATNEESADRVLKWSNAGQEFVPSYKVEGTGDPEQDGFWFAGGTSGVPSEQTVAAGDAFLIQNRHGQQDVFLGGSVVLSATQTVSLGEGLSLFAYPYASKIALNGSALAESGAQGATNMSAADKVTDNATSNQYWLLSRPGSPDDGKWLDATGQVTSLELLMGTGYWYEREGAMALSWNEPRPYENVFGSETNPLCATSLDVTPSHDAVALSISCAGTAGETLEIFYKDLGPNDSFAGSSGWLLADSGIATTGRTSLAWTDAGAANRLPVTSVYCRIYVVGRQDIDFDGDGLSDARETFVHQTSPNASDTDHDGLSDYAEINTCLTDPNDPDTDSDGMGDGAEVAWGYSPTNANIWAALPWEETFEARTLGSINGQNGWGADPSETSLVQSNVVHRGNKALHLLQDPSTPTLHHSFGAQGASNVWLTMWIQPAAGALPDVSELTNRPTAIVAVDSARRLAGYDGLQDEWVVAGNGPIAAGQWIRVTIALDYENRTWKLYYGSQLLLSDLGFKDADVGEFSRAEWLGSAAGSAQLDDLDITATEPADLDDDGDSVPNVWEHQYGFDPNDSADASQDADGDGLSNRQEYLLGTDPTQADSDEDGMADGAELRWGFDPVSSNAFQHLPWSVGFETNSGYAIGSLQGQDNWQVSGGAVVQIETVASGAQAARVGGAGTSSVSAIEHFLAGSPEAVVWTDLKVKMVVGPLSDLGTNTAGLTAVFAVTGQRKLAGYDGSGHAWAVATNTVDVDPAQWLHLTVRKDYATRTWNLYWDGAPVLKDLGFADSSVDRLARFAVQGGSTLGEYLDDLSISTTIPSDIDDDHDGIPNVVEDANDNGAVDAGETDPFSADTDHDGMDDGAELAWGFGPTTSNDFTQLPWSAGFEGGEGYTLGALDDQQGWTASASVTVQLAVQHAGTNAVRIASTLDGEAQMTRYFGAQGQGLVWIDAHVRLRPGALPDPSAVSGTNSVLVAVNQQGLLCAYDSQTGSWVPTAATWKTDPGTWARLTFGMNYVRKTWSAYVDDVRVFQDIPFLNSSVRALSRLKVCLPEGSGLPPDTYVDSMSATTEEPSLLDNDGDGLPNSWERQYGLDPEDPSDKMGDLDGDGLSNYDEYLAGTNPTITDTDGDGVSDGMEVHDTGTDPNQPDIQGVETVLTVNGSDATDLLGEWQTNGTSIYAVSRRGSLAYSMTVPTSDVFRLEIEGASHNRFAITSVFDLLVYVDEEYLGRYPMTVTGTATGLVQAITPWLPQGAHSVRIYWDNAAEYRALEVKVLRLQTLLAPDANANGVKDWVEERITRQCGVEIAPETSVVSPVCIEGRGPYLSMMSVSDASIQHGAGDRWYADVPLSATASVRVVTSFQNNARVVTNNIRWVPTNLIGSGNLTIRKGDSLLLTAYRAGATNGTVAINVAGVTNYVTTVPAPAACLFNSAGVFTVTGIHNDGIVTSNSIQVKVVEAAFNDGPACWVGRSRMWECPQIPQEAVVEHDARIKWEDLGVSTNGARQFRVTADQPEDRYLVARLGETGPVLTNAAAKGFSVRSTVETYVRVVDTYTNGDQVIETLVVLHPVISDVTVRLEMIVGGVTFDDGSVVKELTLADFDELGQCPVRFIRPAAAQTSICHVLKVFENEAFIGMR